MSRQGILTLRFCCLLAAFSATEAASQTPITYGSTVHASIAAAAEVDSFAFTGTSGERITIRLTGTWTTVPRLQLSAPGGALLRNLTGQAIRIDTLLLAATGSYTLRVADDNAVDTGSYSIHVQRLTDPAGATPLPFGETTEDGVTQRADIRAFTFTGTPGDVVTLLVASSWSNAPRIELYDPSGGLKKRIDGQSVRIDTFHVGTAGTYTILALDNDGLQTGTFGLHLQLLTDPVGAVPVEFGQTLQDSLAGRAEIRVMTFSGFAGEVVTALLAGSWSNMPRLEVYDPSGTLRRRLDGQSARCDTMRLPVTGQYVLCVLDNDGQQTGSFGIHLQRIADPVGSTALTTGSTRQDSVTIRAQINTYTFAGNAGDVITLLLAGSWASTPRLELYDPAGTLRKRVDNQNIRLDTVHLPLTGLYTVCVMDNDGQQPGTYGLHLQNIIAPVGAGTLLNGQTIQDAITTRAEINACTFTGSAGDVITLLLAGSWTTQPRLELYDPSGSLKKRIDGQAARADTVHLASDGTYTVFVLDNDGQQTGTYGLVMQRTNTPPGAFPLIKGETIQDTLDRRAGIRVYTFNGTAGEVITVLAAGSWTTMPRLELYDPSGNLRKRSDAQSIRIDTMHLTATGRHTIFVLDNDGQQQGSFGLCVQSLTSPGIPLPLTFGTTVQDSVPVRAGLRTYAFSVSAGDVFTVLLASTWSNASRMELYDPAGVLRKRFDGQSIRFDTMTATSTGQHLLLVCDNDAQQTGAFGLHLQRIGMPAGGRAIGYGETVQDTIAERAVIRAFTFDGESGETIAAMFASTLTGTGRLELYDPSGRMRKRVDGQFIRFDTLQLSASGTYTLLALDNDGQQAGTFGIHLQRIGAPAGGRTLAFGETVQDTLAQRAQIRAFTFTAQSGDVVLVRLAANGVASYLSVIDVYSPAAGLLRRTAASNDIRIDTLRLSAGGTYTLFVEDNDGQQTGTFGVHVQRITGPGAATELAFGQTVQDTVYVRAGIIPFVFAGTAGDVVTAKIAGTGVSGFLTTADVYAPSGRLMRRTTGSLDIRIDTLRLTESGQHTVLVADNDCQQAGDFGIHLQRIVTPGAARQVAFGETVPDTIYQRAEINAYTFAAGAGSVVTLRMFATGLSFPLLELYQTDGRLWKRITGSNALRMDTLHCPAAGTYTVLIGDDNGQETGNSWLHLQNITNPAGARAITYGATVQDTLYHRTQIDAYTFSGAALDTVSVLMSASWSGGPQLELYRSDGALLKRVGGTGTAHIDTLKLPAAGIYTLFALDNDGAQTGSHTITLTARTSSTTTVTSIVGQGWNMLSVPAVAADLSRNGVYPGSIAGAYRYVPGSGYTLHDTLATLTGYWIKFGAAQVIPVTGTIMRCDTIPVAQGWNMIGTISLPVPVSSIATIPPGILTGSFFGYNGTYSVVDTLSPGRGFWMKTTAPGSIILGTPALSPDSGVARHKAVERLARHLVGGASAPVPGR